jgi:hypothetical protein
MSRKINQDTRGAILVSTQLTWNEAMIILGLLSGSFKGPLEDQDDPAIASIRSKMEHVVNTVKHN